MSAGSIGNRYLDFTKTNIKVFVSDENNELDGLKRYQYMQYSEKVG